MCVELFWKMEQHYTINVNQHELVNISQNVQQIEMFIV
jgi:hypothetical protein